MDWKEEMNKMLYGFECQAISSLNNIKMSFKSNGLSFNPKFKEYFLEASINRLELTYNQTVKNSQLEEQLFDYTNQSSSRATSSTGSAANSTHVKSESENQTHNLIEIDDSSDEEDTSRRSNTASQSTQQAKAQMIPPLGSLNATTNDIGDRSNQYIRSERSTRNTHDSNNSIYGMEDITDQFGINLTLREQRNANLNSDENVSKGPSSSGTSEVKSEVNDIASDNLNVGVSDDSLANKFDTVIEIDESDDEEAVAEILKTGPVVDGPSCATAIDEVPVIGVKQTTFDPLNDQEVNLHTYNTHALMASLANTSLSVPFISNISKNTTVTVSEKYVSTQIEAKKRFSCTVCQYSTQSKAYLVIHTRTHTGEKPFLCDRCGRGFITLHKLYKHGLVHTDVFPFHCVGCFRGFLLKFEKEAHDKVCKTRRYQCHICKRFVPFGITMLIRHMRSHTGEKPFQCEICLKRFSMKSNLKIHLKNIHGRINT